MTLVSVLFARADSVYKTLPDCDVWDIDRNALNWQGGSPVVAHPPCRAWGRLAHMARPRPGERELALWAVDQIRQYGGVLEHPDGSRLWKEKPLPAVGETDAWGGFTIVVSQFVWGHRAEKKTKLYICGCSAAALPPIPIRIGEPQFVVSTSGRRKDGSRSRAKKEIKKSEREATPILFAIWLLEAARRCHKP
jgi:hypothetical protein